MPKSKKGKENPQPKNENIQVRLLFVDAVCKISSSNHSSPYAIVTEGQLDRQTDGQAKPNIPTRLL